MVPTELEPAVEKALRKERGVLRAMISNFHNMLLSNDFDSIDVEVVKSSRTRLSEINTQLIGHLLAQEKDVDQELAKNEEYAEKTGTILSSHPNADVTPKQGNSSSLGKIKLPAIVAKDSASWIKFRMLLESAPGFKTATDDEKKAQLVAALPPILACDIQSLSYTEAIRKLETEFESEESLRTSIRELFRKTPKVKNLDDQAGMKTVHEAIDSVISLANKVGLEKETMALAFRKLSKPVAYGFLKEYKSKKLANLSTYLKEQAMLIDWYREMMGEEDTSRKPVGNGPTNPEPTGNKTQKPWLKKPFRKQGGQKEVNAIAMKAESDSESDDPMYQHNKNKNISAYPVSALYSDASESEDENDEIIIDAEFEGKQVPMLFDPGAKKNLLPAKQFKSPTMEMRPRFRSATGHIIKSSDPKRFKMGVKGATIPIKAYVNDKNLSILGRQFTKKCSVTTDGQNTKEIAYHDKGTKTVVYKDTDAKSHRKTNKIFQILPCGGDDLVDDILSDLKDDDDHSGMILTGEKLATPQLPSLLQKFDFLGRGLGDAGKGVMHRIYVEPGTTFSPT